MHKRERRERFFLCVREEIFGKRVDKRTAFFGKLTVLPLFLFILFFLNVSSFILNLLPNVSKFTSEYSKVFPFFNE